MPDDLLARATVAVVADLTAFDAAMGQLGPKMRAEIQKDMAIVQAEMKNVKLEINAKMAAGSITERSSCRNTSTSSRIDSTRSR